MGIQIFVACIISSFIFYISGWILNFIYVYIPGSIGFSSELFSSCSSFLLLTSKVFHIHSTPFPLLSKSLLSLFLSSPILCTHLAYIICVNISFASLHNLTNTNSVAFIPPIFITQFFVSASKSYFDLYLCNLHSDILTSGCLLFPFYYSLILLLYCLFRSIHPRQILCIFCTLLPF